MVTKYNGWTNYETWSVALFFDNEQYLYNEIVEVASKLSLVDLMEFLKEGAYTLLDVESANIYAQQMLNASLAMVNWREVAQHYKEGGF